MRLKPKTDRRPPSIDRGPRGAGFALALAALLFSFSVTPSQAQSAGAFARMGFGARGIAMGNGLVADLSGQGSPFYNPSLAPYLAEPTMEASAALLGLDRELLFLQFAAPLKPRGGLAAGLIRGGVSGIDGRDGSGFHTGELSTEEFVLFVAFGARIGERVALGGGFRLYRANLYEGVDEATSIALSLGANVRVTDALTLGVTVDDLLARYVWDTSRAFGSEGRTTTDRLPIRLRLGASYRLGEGRGVVAGEYEARFLHGEERVPTVTVFNGIPSQGVRFEDRLLYRPGARLGGEYWLTDAFAARAGLSTSDTASLEALEPSVGFALQHQIGELAFRFDYAFALAPYAVTTAHYLTLKFTL